MSPATLKRVASTDRDISPPPKRKVPPSVTAASVANFFKPASDKIREPEKVSFRTHDTVIIARYNKDAILGRKVAAFDFDDTLVTTSSGNRFSRDAQDWKWWNASVPDKLKQLHDEGFHLVVISNQAAIKLRPDPKTLKADTKSLNNFKGKVTNVLTRLDLPITVYAATAHDIYRKPRAGMWQLLDLDVDLEKSIFVGDAAGRSKDHSSSDRDLASNIGIPFSTPEEFFLNEAPKPFTRVFEPSTYLGKTQINFAKVNDVDIVLFCGSPGAGKSTFYWTYLEPLHYVRANQDILKTRERCMQVATEAIQSGKGVAVDNTNADTEVRAAWVTLARRLKVPIRLVHFTSPAKLCEHNNTVRALSNIMNPEDRKLLPKMAFSGYAARYREPTLEEGFTDITRVDFLFSGTEEEEKVWRRYWVS